MVDDCELFGILPIFVLYIYLFYYCVIYYIFDLNIFDATSLFAGKKKKTISLGYGPKFLNLFNQI